MGESVVSIPCLDTLLHNPIEAFALMTFASSIAFIYSIVVVVVARGE